MKAPADAVSARPPFAEGSKPEAAGSAIRPLAIGDVRVWPPIVLAPMAGETGSVLRRLCRRMGAGLVVTELTSSHGLYYRNRRSFEYLRWTEDEKPLSAQLFGAEPEVMAEAARMCCDAGADLIDINMGCWVPKVAKTGAGASLLRDVCRAANVMTAVVKASSVPVTIKTRVGWDGCIGSAVEMARVAEDVGVCAVAIHGRTAIQGFTGDADWGPIAEAVRAVRIPVIGNGDIRSPEDAARMFRETRCAGVMIGRAALGNPWIFREVSSFLLDARTHAPPTQHERLETTLEHARLLALHTHGECRPDTPMPGIARGQLLHYLVGMPGVAAARKQMARINCYADVCSIVESLRPFSRLGRSERAWGPTPLAPVPLP